jgi:N-acetyl-anhydromuramyl-L-alanine amidase AmpD
MSVTLEPADVKLIVVHCSATPPEDDIGAKEIRTWHVNIQGWSDIGYHGIIRRDGSFERGRPLHQRGAHAKGYNSQSWGLCLIGGTKTGNDFQAEANYTSKQYETLWATLDAWRTLAPRAATCGHRDLDSTHQALKACPSFDVREYYLAHRLRR